MTTASNWDATNRGMDFGKTDKKLVGTGSGQSRYPAAGSLNDTDCSLYDVGNSDRYWSCAPFHFC